jgi:hypothetical protein
MIEKIDRQTREELFHLYSELQARCARAASALKLSLQWDTTGEELLARFHREEASVGDIWRQIQSLKTTRVIKKR